MSYGLYVGRNRTGTGHAYLAGYGDEPSSHWLEIVPAADHKPGSTLRVGVTEAADMPGRLTDIAQAEHTARSLRVSYSHYKGVPAPLSNGGLNEHGVAVRDIWSTSRHELIDMTPKDQTGPNYSDLAKLVLDRARSAREGVELIGALIAEHGYSTYGGNSHLIADPDEAWVVIEFAGGRKLWVAERLGPDAIRASRPGHVGVIPAESGGDVLFPDHFIDTAIRFGWHDPASGRPFDVNAVFGDGKGPWAGARFIEEEMASRSERPGKIGLADMMWAVRTPKLTGDTAGYGQIVPLVHPRHAALRMMWHAPIGAVATPFMPVFLGMTEVAEEYRQHRYLTDGEAARFMDMRHALAGRHDTVSLVPQGIEASRSAVAVFKRLLYLALRSPQLYLPFLESTFVAFEKAMAADIDKIDRICGLLLDAGETDLAAWTMTRFSNDRLRDGLRMGEELAAALEARIRVTVGFDTDPVPASADQIW